jgi:hypothetical protein
VADKMFSFLFDSSYLKNYILEKKICIDSDAMKANGKPHRNTSLVSKATTGLNTDSYDEKYRTTLFVIKRSIFAKLYHN